MHKKLVSELKSLAHDILRLQKDEDIFAIKAKASELNDKLAVLVYIEKYIVTSPQATETKEELISAFEKNINNEEELKEPVVGDLFSEVNKEKNSSIENAVALDVVTPAEVNELLDKEEIVRLDVEDSFEVNELLVSEEIVTLDVEDSSEVNELLVSEETVTLDVEDSFEVNELLVNEEIVTLDVDNSAQVEEEVESNELLGNPNEVLLSVTPKEVINSIELVDEEVFRFKYSSDNDEQCVIEEVNQDKESLETSDNATAKVVESDVSSYENTQETIENKNENQEYPKYSEYVHSFNKKTLEKDVELKVSSHEYTKDDIVEEKNISQESEEVKKNTLEDELQDTISVDVMTDLFTKKIEPQTSLNDRLSINQNIRIGLNDRIAFVNNLFNQDQAEFNRVLRELNVLRSFDESVKYVRYNVKSTYDWSGKEDYEDRFIEIIRRRFE